MTGAPDPDVNPYAAPRSDLGGGAAVRPPPAFRGYAGFWRRLFAYAVDVVALAVIAVVSAFSVGVILGLVSAAVGDQDLIDRYVGVLGPGVVFLVPVLYFPVMESSGAQATFGKLALGVKVTDLSGRRISLPRALGRHLGKILSSVSLVGFFMAAFTEKKQALHDMIAGTLVLTLK